MWIITVVVTFLSAAIGVNIPDSLFEGPMVVKDEQGRTILYASEAECRSEAEMYQPRIMLAEQHVHGTDGLKVSWTCTVHTSDL